MKRILVILCLLILASCSQQAIIIEDLSVATPVEAEAQGSSYVKITEPAEQTEKTLEEDTTELEKKVYREGDLIFFEPIGVDPDGDVITYTYSKPLNENGEWQTQTGDVGTYLVTITASDGKEEVEKKVVLLVLSANRAPTIEGLEDMTVAEGELITLQPKVFDYNNDEVTIEYSKPFNKNGEWQTTYEDSGTYIVKITVSDSEMTTEKQITIVVKDTNRAPVIEDIEPITAFAGERIVVEPEATDADGNTVVLSFEKPLSVDGVWQTTEENEGTYTLAVTASDGMTSSEKEVTIVLNHKNKAPVITLAPITAQETELVVLQPTIVDPEGDEFTVTYSEPFVDSQWQTGYDDAGEYTVLITATDSNGAVSTYSVSVTITDKNRAPTFKI